MACNRPGTCVLVALRPFTIEHGSHDPPITWEGSTDQSQFKAAGGLDYVLGHLIVECIKLRMQPFHFHIDMEGQ